MLAASLDPRRQGVCDQFDWIGGLGAEVARVVAGADAMVAGRPLECIREDGDGQGQNGDGGQHPAGRQFGRRRQRILKCGDRAPAVDRRQAELLRDRAQVSCQMVGMLVAAVWVLRHHSAENGREIDRDRRIVRSAGRAASGSSGRQASWPAFRREPADGRSVRGRTCSRGNRCRCGRRLARLDRLLGRDVVEGAERDARLGELAIGACESRIGPGPCPRFWPGRPG